MLVKLHEIIKYIAVLETSVIGELSVENLPEFACRSVSQIFVNLS